jgi:hypothetical protein
MSALTSMARPALTLLDFSGRDLLPCTAWIILLGELSCLRSLYIKGAIGGSNIPTSTIPDPTWTITLPHLENMTIYDAVSDVARTASFAELVNHLILPNTCAIHFNLRHYSPYHVPHLYAAGACQDGTIVPVKPPRYIFFGTSHYGALRMAVYADDISLSTTTCCEGRTLPVSDTSPQSRIAIPVGSSSAMSLTQICSELPLHSVYGLGFGSVDGPILECFGRLGSIHDAWWRATIIITKTRIKSEPLSSY